MLFSRSIVSWLFATSWTVARQASLSMGFSRQENWSGLPFPSPGDLLSPGDRTCVSCIADGFFTTEPPGKAKISLLGSNLCIIKLTHFKCTGMGVLVNFDSLLEMLLKWNGTRHLVALSHPWLQRAHRLFPFYCGIVFHWLDIAHFFYPFYSW